MSYGFFKQVSDDSWILFEYEDSQVGICYRFFFFFTTVINLSLGVN